MSLCCSQGGRREGRRRDPEGRRRDPEGRRREAVAETPKAVAEAPKAAEVAKAKAEAGSSKVVSELTIQTCFRIQENYESMLQPRRSSRRPSPRPQRPSPDQGLSGGQMGPDDVLGPCAAGFLLPL